MSEPSEDIVWKKCLEVIKSNISEQSFKTWFEPIIPYLFDGRKLTIQVPSQFFYEWLEENYVQLLRRALDDAIGREGMLEYSIIVDSGNRSQNKPPIAVNMTQTKTNSKLPPAPDPQEKPIRSPFDLRDLQNNNLESYLNPNYSFDNYIEGDCNRLARAASFAVAQKPSVTSFNPLMIYGGVGLGKTHLVQAIGNYVKKRMNNKFVLYVSSEKFTNQFINAIRENSLQDFMSFYMQVDVLILDDVQFLSGKKKPKKHFFIFLIICINLESKS